MKLYAMNKSDNALSRKAVLRWVSKFREDQARIQDFLTGGGALIFPRCSTVPGNRLISEIFRLGGLGWRALALPSLRTLKLYQKCIF